MKEEQGTQNVTYHENREGYLEVFVTMKKPELFYTYLLTDFAIENEIDKYVRRKMYNDAHNLVKTPAVFAYKIEKGVYTIILNKLKKPIKPKKLGQLNMFEKTESTLPSYINFILDKEIEKLDEGTITIDYWKEIENKEYNKTIELKIGGNVYQYDIMDNAIIDLFKKTVKYKPGRALDILRKNALNILKKSGSKWDVIDK